MVALLEGFISSADDTIMVLNDDDSFGERMNIDVFCL
jgi:hypothetical protein